MKGRRGRTNIVFDNLIGSISESDLLGFAGFGDDNAAAIVEMDGGRWAVGQTAAALSRNPRAEVGYARYDQPEFKVMIAALLGELYPSRGGEVALTFSLPVDGFGRSKQVIKTLAGEWQFRYKGRDHRFTIPSDSIWAVPEAFGSLCYFALTADGKDIANIDLTEQRVAVIDVGGFTTDVLTFRELDLQSTFGSVEQGILDVQRSINRSLKREFNRGDLDHRDLQAMLLNGTGRYKYRHAGRAHDVTEIVESAVWELTQGVLQIWNDDLGAGLDYDAVIFTGGGSPIIRPFLERRIDHGNIIRVDDQSSHLANVIGAARYRAFMRQMEG
jgi:hypothetical protein